MTNQQDANVFIMSGGARGAKFLEVGDTVWGTIMSLEMRQQTEIKTGALSHWPDGNPKMQAIVTLLTEELEDDEDDGLRAVYVRGQMQSAVRNAIIKANASALQEGGKLLVRFMKEVPPTTKGFNPAKHYFAKYDPPRQEILAEALAEAGVEPDDLPF